MKPICYSLPIFAILLLIAGCDKNNEVKPAGEYSNSIFIINEGPFPAGTGTISAFDRDSLRVTPDLFETINGRPLGNIVQSLTVFNDKAYIVVNNANKIEVVNLSDFKSVATIEGLTLPRYFIGINKVMGYVSCWDSTVKVIDLEHNSVISSIHTGIGPDKMLLADDYLFVINSGGYSDDSTVTVISVKDQEIAGQIVVGYHPSGIRKDASGNVWVLSSGKGWNNYPNPSDTRAKLVCIDPVSLQIIKEIIFPDSGNHPDNLIADENADSLFYSHPLGIFVFPVSADALNPLPLIPDTTMYYGLGYDPAEKLIYGSDPLDGLQNGWVYRFNASDGTPAGSFMVGIMPSGFWFNR
jgi:hypothetical protein